MKKIRNILLTIVAMLALASCEVEMNPKNGSEGYSPIGVAMSSIASTDTTLSVWVTNVYNFNRIPSTIEVDGRFGFLKNESLEKAAAKDADVRLIVNDSEAVKLEYDNLTSRYVCDYKPKGGDRLELEVKTPKFDKMSSALCMPSPVPFTVLKYEKVYSPAPVSASLLSDSAVVLYMRFADPANVRNFYRMDVRSESVIWSKNDKTGEMVEIRMYNDIFTSDDPIFRDPQIASGYRGWDACFLEAFTDELIDGKTYDFAIKIQLIEAKKQRVSVDLQAITEDFYHYVRALRIYQTSEVYNEKENVSIPGNVNKGLGIFGGITSAQEVFAIDL